MKSKTSKTKRILAVVLAAVCILALCFAALISPTGASANMSYSDKTNEGSWDMVSAADWMGNVNGALKLSEISMPGSHDTGTQYVTLPLIGRCQDSSIPQQLDMGVRVLDIRLNTHDDGSGGVALTISHGFLDCKERPYLAAESLSFDKVLSDCREFLKAHPTETILMLVKHENGDATPQQVQDALAKAFGDASDIYTENRNPSLDEVRGKIILARRYGEAADGLEGLNFCWADQGGEGVAGTPYAQMEVSPDLRLYVQDRYEYGLQDKINAVTYCLDNSQAKDDSLLLNYLSTKGTSTYGVPKNFAADMNKWFIEKELLSGKNYGCVMFDFVSEGLARHVFATNKYYA